MPVRCCVSGLRCPDDRRTTAPPRAQTRGPADQGRAAALGPVPVHRSEPARGTTRGERAQDARRPVRCPVKALAIGRPLASEEELGERLTKKKALAIFSSDAISSSAYATEEILRVLIIGGAAAFLLSVEVAIAIAILLAVVALSYRQVCLAFPDGGGAYAVAKRELTPLLALVAASALLIDYVMTVAVSTSSAVDQLISVSPGLNPFRIEIALLAITLITVANLRGLRESGNIFAIPTYLFVGLALTIIVMGVISIVTGDVTPWPRQEEAVELGTEPIGLFLLLRAFASGSVALTGTEAIANGVPAFKPPEARNAATTMVAMAILLAILFVGVTIVADAYQIVPSEEGSGGPTVIALVAQTAFGVGTPLFYIFQGATALILFLAANTSYNAFPRLGALLAKDGYMPRQFSFRGDRLAFSWGIILLSVVAGLLIIAFGGITTFLIPLYSVGVFVCFTISQTGMVRHWLRTREPGWRWRMSLNATGAVMTAVVLVVVASVKFFSGAYLVVILMPLLVLMMLFISRQYRHSTEELGRVAGIRLRAAAAGGAGRRARARDQSGGHPGGQRRPVHRGRRPGRLHQRRPRGCDRGTDGLGAHATGRATRGRRVTISGVDGAADRLSGRPRRGVAAGQGGTDHVRRAARVRRPQLVGAAALQPVLEAAAPGPARATAHGHRQCPVSPRGRGRRGRGRSRPQALAPARPTDQPRVGREVAQPTAQQHELALEQRDEALESLDGGVGLEQGLAARQLDLDDAGQQVRQDRGVVRDPEVGLGAWTRARSGRSIGVRVRVRVDGHDPLDLGFAVQRRPWCVVGRRRRIDLDPDVQLLRQFAVACPHEVEVADESPDGARGEAFRARLVADVVVERRDLGHEVRLLAGIDGLDREAARAGGQEVEPAIRVATRFADLGERAHARQRGDPVRTDLASVADQHDAERVPGVEAAPGHLAVALLEDVERQDDAWAEHHVEREERDLHGHRSDASWVPGRARTRRVRGWPSLVLAPEIDEAAGSTGGFEAMAGFGQCEQPFGAPSSSAVRKLEPQPQAATAFGLFTVKPAPMSVST